MPQYLEVLTKITEIESQLGYRLPPPCTPAQLKTVQDETMAKLGLQVPAEYLEFLRLHNGLAWNGLHMYGVEEYEFSPSKIAGMVEMNLLRREVPVPTWTSQHLCLGDTGDDSYGLRLTDGRYCGVDVVSGYVFQEYESFDEMIDSVLRELLSSTDFDDE